MPDITMCDSKECPKRKDCYRSTAKPSGRQSMADFYDQKKNCGYFWEENQDCEPFEDITYEEALVEMGYTLRKETK
jgi:hypothetical protein